MPAATTIYLIRHGQVHNPNAVFYGRLAGFGLDASGREQARRAASSLRDKQVATVFASPLLRARQTARELLAACGSTKPLHISKLLTEVHTAFEGRPSAEVDALRDDIYTDVPAPFEQPADIVARARRFMQRVRRRYAGKAVAAVTHGDIIVFMILWAQGLGLTPENKLRFSATGVLDTYPAHGSITTFTYTTLSQDELPSVRYSLPA